MVAYKIYRNNSTTALASVTPTGTLSYKDAAVSANTGYSYYVVALDAAGNVSQHSNTASATTPAAQDKTAPSVPTGLKAGSVTTSSVTLTWNPSTDTGGSGLAGYHVYRDNVLIASPSTNSYIDTGLNPSTSHTYSVSAYDNAANGSNASSSISVTTAAASSGTTVQNVKWNSSAQTLTWDAFQGAGAYTVATVHNPLTTSAYTVYTYPRVVGTSYKPPVLKGETVAYSVSPVNGGATGAGTALGPYSQSVQVTWPGSSLVQNLKWNSSTKTLTWDAFAGAGAYTVAATYNPGTSSRYTTYTYPRIVGTSYKPSVVYGKTVDYSVSPVKGGATGSGTALAPYSQSVRVVWPSKPWWQVW